MWAGAVQVCCTAETLQRGVLSLPLTWLRNALGCCHLWGPWPLKDPHTNGVNVSQRSQGVPSAKSTHSLLQQGLFPWKHSRLKKTKPVLSVQPANTQPHCQGLLSPHEGGESQGMGYRAVSPQLGAPRLGAALGSIATCSHPLGGSSSSQTCYKQIS